MEDLEKALETANANLRTTEGKFSNLLEAEKNAHKKDVEAFEKYRAEMEDRLAKENELHAKDMEEREKLLDALEAEKHERSDLEIQLRTAREMQKQSNTELRNAAEQKEKELQKKIADLGQTRLDLKKQLQQALPRNRSGTYRKR